MGRYSNKLDVYSKTSVENEVCPFCDHRLPVGVTECKCGAFLKRGGAKQNVRDYRLGLLIGIAFTIIYGFGAYYFYGSQPGNKYGLWGIAITCLVFYLLKPKKIEKVWWRNNEFAYRQIWIDE